MEKYTPPFTITPAMLSLVALISEKVGKIGFLDNPESRPHLRRNNRIRSIHSSLKIEANSLSLTEVRDVIDGHAVAGDRKEILEVKNAYAAYERAFSADPYSTENLKLLHSIMMEGIIPDAGAFRRGQEGVFSGGQCIFIAPPPGMVPGLMESLFAWMRSNRDKIHPLILAAVFHYEFVFIHPFSDGNGRMARLWHTLLLASWRSIFAYIPLESKIEAFQEEYYRAIAACHKNGNSNVFIEFILDKTDLILDDVLLRLQQTGTDSTVYLRRLLGAMAFDTPYTARELMTALGLKSGETFRKNYISPALAGGYVIMTLPDKPTSRNQQYIRKK